MFTFQNGIFIVYFIPTILLVYIAHEIVEQQKFDITTLHIVRKVSRNRVIEGDELFITLEIYNTSEIDSQQIEILDILQDGFLWEFNQEIVIKPKVVVNRRVSL